MMVGRLTVEECMESSFKHNNPNLRRLSDAEYNELQESEPRVRRYLLQQEALMKGSVLYD